MGWSRLLPAAAVAAMLVAVGTRTAAATEQRSPTAQLRRDSLRVDTLVRTFRYYAPPGLSRERP
jgi:hypothetical protein